MSKAFTLNVKESKEYVIECNGLEVIIKPLSKREEAKLVDKHTKGKISILQSRQKKGFRKDKNEKDEIRLPDIDHIELNIEKAVLTWKDWNIEFEGKKTPCDKSSIEFLFNNHYDTLAVPIMEKLEEMIEVKNEEEDDEPEKGKS